MTAKDYLSQAFYLNQRINSKLEQLSALKELATRCTSVISGMPRNPNSANDRMADAVVKIVDMEAEINRDIDELVELKRDMMSVIKSVDNPKYRMLLELRHLCFKTWQQIAEDMGYSIQHIYRLRNRAYEKIDDIFKDERKC